MELDFREFGKRKKVTVKLQDIEQEWQLQCGALKTINKKGNGLVVKDVKVCIVLKLSV